MLFCYRKRYAKAFRMNINRVISDKLAIIFVKRFPNMYTITKLILRYAYTKTEIVKAFICSA